MEIKKVGNNLIVIGFLLFIIAGGLFTFITSYWASVSFWLIHEEIVLEKNITILGCVITIILNSCAFGFTVIGGRFAEKSRDYWLILVGLILLIINLFIGAVGYLVSLFGIDFIFFTIPMLIIYYIKSGCGITFIIIGALMRIKNRKR